jgi:hypothetical protein
MTGREMQAIVEPISSLNLVLSGFTPELDKVYALRPHSSK